MVSSKIPAGRLVSKLLFRNSRSSLVRPVKSLVRMEVRFLLLRRSSWILPSWLSSVTLVVPGNSIQLCQNAFGDFFGAFVEDRAVAVNEFFLRGGGWRKKRSEEESDRGAAKKAGKRACCATGGFAKGGVIVVGCVRGLHRFDSLECGFIILYEKTFSKDWPPIQEESSFLIFCGRGIFMGRLGKGMGAANRFLGLTVSPMTRWNGATAFCRMEWEWERFAGRRGFGSCRG